MILAAGLGTRLRPLTDRIPKALVEVGGRPLLARVVDRLKEAGTERIVVNTHHHGTKIREYLRKAPFTNVEIVLSPEPGERPLDTGGGLFHAAPLFREERPFFLHNVDVLSEISLAEVMARHREGRVQWGRESESEPRESGGTNRLVASLAVQDRDAGRALLFDEVGLLGWENRGSDRAPEGAFRARDRRGEVRRLAFTGIHVVEPAIFRLSPRRGAFSVITLYLELAAEGWVIQPVDVTGEEWMDVGTPRRLEAARKRFGQDG
jgi:NDP-sugar pyrophosphorylase family protein